MTSKQCFKCLCEKPLSEFYKHPRMADGHLNKCKDCTKQDIHAHRHGQGREKVLAYDRERALPQRTALAQRIAMAHAKERLIRLAQLDGWGRLYNAGRVADSKQQHGQEAV